MPSRKKFISEGRGTLSPHVEGTLLLYPVAGWAALTACPVVFCEACSRESESPSAPGIRVQSPFFRFWLVIHGRFVRQHTLKEFCCSHVKCSAWIDPAVQRCYNYLPPKYINLFIQVSELSPDNFKDVCLKLSKHCSALCWNHGSSVKWRINLNWIFVLK